MQALMNHFASWKCYLDWLCSWICGTEIHEWIMNVFFFIPNPKYSRVHFEYTITHTTHSVAPIQTHYSWEYLRWALAVSSDYSANLIFPLRWLLSAAFIFTPVDAVFQSLELVNRSAQTGISQSFCTLQGEIAHICSHIYADLFIVEHRKFIKESVPENSI